MITNTKATLYRRSKAGYAKEVIETVMWQDVIKQFVSDKGLISESMGEIYIPFYAITMPPKRGDIIVKGECFYPLSHETTSNLKAFKLTGADPREVIVVEVCDYGSLNMRHWEVVAKWA